MTSATPGRLSEGWYIRRSIRKAALEALPHTSRDIVGENRLPYMPIPPIPAPNNKCPRCGGPVPDAEHKGEWSGAISRTDNKTEICTACGNHESDQDQRDLLTPKVRWPIGASLVQAMRSPNPQLPMTEPASLLIGTKDWKLGPPMRKPFSPGNMPDLRWNLMDGWVKWWQSPFESVPQTQLLNDASLWWVGDEMCDLLYSTLPEIPADTMTENLTLPAPYGLIYFAKEWWGGVDAETGERDICVNAVTWGHGLVGPEQEPCISISSYRYLDFDKGLTAKDGLLLEGLGLSDGGLRRPGTAAIDQLAAMGAPMKLRKVNGKMENAVSGGIWAPLGRSDWPHSFRLDAPSATSHLMGPVGASPIAERVGTESFDLSAQEDRRLIAAFFSLIQAESLTRVVDETPSRQVVRQAQRKNKPVPPTVKVVYLRRPQRKGKPGAEGAGGHLSYRFPVRAHSRLQACGPGLSQRKLIMIAPYIKGPEDGPFVPKTTVNAWVR